MTTVTAVDAPGAAAELADLARAAPSDEAAMAEFVRRTTPVVWRTCAALVDPQAADDLCQEVFVGAVRGLTRWRGEGSVVSWLVGIARRVCADEIASRQRVRQIDAEARRRFTTVLPDPTRIVDVADAVDRLAPARREAFLLTVVAGVPYADAARACGCSIGTIRSRVSRARAQLVDALTDGSAAALDRGGELVS